MELLGHSVVRTIHGDAAAITTIVCSLQAASKGKTVDRHTAGSRAGGLLLVLPVVSGITIAVVVIIVAVGQR